MHLLMRGEHYEYIQIKMPHLLKTFLLLLWNWSIEYELKETVLHDDIRYLFQIYNR